MTVFRRLRELGYSTSYTHGGRYYGLTELLEFDDRGLWFYRDVGFSRAGTLKETVTEQIDAAPDGRTHSELRNLLRVRVQNTLLELFRQGRVGRALHEGVLLYVSAQPERGAGQIEARREGDRAVAEIFEEPTAEETIEVLAEALRGTADIPSAAEVSRRLAARDMQVGPGRVQRVFASQGLVPGKKTAPAT